MVFKIAILGCPNVGKSSLFNKLCGKKLAIVDDVPGVTRDRKVFAASFGDLCFELVDTAGWEGENSGHLSQLMAKQSYYAGDDADIILFMIDAKHGVRIDDYDFANQVKKLNKPVVLLVNKCDSNRPDYLDDIYKLGLGDPIFFAVHSGLGFDDLYHRLSEFSKNMVIEESEELLPTLKISIVGRPNVGKSTLFNNILQMERSVVSDYSGTTRDSIRHLYDYEGKCIELIDTAGLRKRKKIDNPVEDMSSGESINAIRRSNVVILVVDAMQPLEKQDLQIAHIAINEGKGVIIVVNKIDLVSNKNELMDEINYLTKKHMQGIAGMPIIPISAIKKIDTSVLFDNVIKLFEKLNFEINTGKLNRWLEGVTAAHIPPIAKNGKRIRFKYAIQSSLKPPTFTFFVNVPEELPNSYNKYLSNSLREQFDLGGVPIRINYRKNHNPYVK